MLIKVCCIQDEREVVMAIESGATHVGLVGEMPSGPGPIPDEAIARIAASVPDSVVSVLLTSRTAADAIVDHVRNTGVRAVQIVQEVPASVRHAVKAELPDVAILQVVHVEDASALPKARVAAEGADHVLLDSGRPTAATPEFGGTGRTHDWSVSATIVAALDVPVFLAGGLRPENVRDAIDAVSPAGVDLCSGIRRPDRSLDPERLSAFMRGTSG